MDEAIEFVGYETTEVTGATLLHILAKGEEVEQLGAGEKGLFYLTPTPFYGESGGQIGDTGFITGEGFKIRVDDTQKTKTGHIYAVGTVEEGIAAPGKVDAVVDKKRREKTRRNHSVTHLLHKALKDQLGDHVNQAGSYVGPDFMRFDFTHYEGVSDADLRAVEEAVNEAIFKSMPVKTEILSYDEAKDAGAVGLFEDKYGDEVRVVSMGDYSKELCGGTHVDNTAQIGLFKILSESGISAGVRRVETVTGPAVYELLNRSMGVNKKIAGLLKVTDDVVIDKLVQHLDKEKGLEKELSKLHADMAKSKMAKEVGDVESIAGIHVIRGHFTDVAVEDLRNMAEKLRDKENALIVLSTVSGGKVNFVCASPKNLIEKGFKAGDIVREVAKIAGGGGGGRPDMATAGAKDANKVEEAMARVKDIVNAIGN